jgi:hypothetical protein
MFMGLNSKCAHQVRPPSGLDSEAFRRAFVMYQA